MNNKNTLEDELQELKLAFDVLKHVHDSTNLAVDRLTIENNQLKDRINILAAEKSQWESEKIKQYHVIQKSLSDSNKLSNKYIEEIQSLKDELNILRGS
jgi:regulator of replication initiation timing